MRREGRARRELIARLTPRDRGLIIDVGADHGHVAHSVGAVATERMPNRRGRSDLRWVVADGLAPFRSVDVAVIAGMGAKTIAGILTRGPTPKVAVLHAPDDPPALRLWLASHGFRIMAEGLAPEARRFAEVIRVEPGVETATGLALELGPRLLEGGDPLLAEHLQQLSGWYTGIAQSTANRAPPKHTWAAERAAFCNSELARLST